MIWAGSYQAKGWKGNVRLKVLIEWLFCPYKKWEIKSLCFLWLAWNVAARLTIHITLKERLLTMVLHSKRFLACVQQACVVEKSIAGCCWLDATCCWGLLVKQLHSYSGSSSSEYCCQCSQWGFSDLCLVSQCTRYQWVQEVEGRGGGGKSGGHWFESRCQLKGVNRVEAWPNQDVRMAYR